MCIMYYRRPKAGLPFSICVFRPKVKKKLAFINHCFLTTTQDAQPEPTYFSEEVKVVGSSPWLVY